MVSPVDSNSNILPQLSNALSSQGYTVKTSNRKGECVEQICFRWGEKSWRVGHKRRGQKRDLEVAKILSEKLSKSLPTKPDARALETFYKRHFKKFTIDKMHIDRFNQVCVNKAEENVRRLDAYIYGGRIFPEDPLKAAALGEAMVKQPKLHYFLRCQYFHTVLTTLRQRQAQIQEGRPDWEPPEPQITDEGVKLPVVEEGEKKWVLWKDFEKRLVFEETKEPLAEGEIQLGEHGDFRGVMMDGWITYQGIDIKPKEAIEKAEEVLTENKEMDNEVFLALLQSGFVEADKVANKEGIKEPIFSIMSDSKLGKPQTRGIHGLFRISVPSKDGKSLHRFVMGSEREKFSFVKHRGRATLLDIRHYKTFSGNKELVSADFLLKPQDLPKVWAALTEFRKEGASVYGQMQQNCCTVVRKLAESVDIKIDPSMHTFEYIRSKFGPKRRTKMERVMMHWGMGWLVNILLFLKGARKSDVKGEKAHFSGLRDVLKPGKAYMHSPFIVAKKCEEINKYRSSFGSLFEKDLGRKLGKKYRFLLNEKAKIPKKYKGSEEQIKAIREEVKEFRGKIDEQARFLVIPEWVKDPQRKSVSAAEEKTLKDLSKTFITTSDEKIKSIA